jgi:ketosteroid isomerase-like protein
MIDSAPMRRAWLSLAAAAVVGCAPLIAGCGGNSGDHGTARDAAQDYVQARNQGDAGRVCELYSDELISKLGASNCEAFVKEQTAGVATSFTLVGVKENGDQATATLRAAVAGTEIAGGAGRLQITLERQGDDWKITSLGSGGGAAE